MKSGEFDFCQALPVEQAGQLHALFQNEWWSAGRTQADVRVMLENSDFTFGIVATGSQELLAFARVLTDRVFKAVIFDVIVHPAHRAAGLGSALMEHILAHEAISRVQHIELYCLPERARFYQRHDFSGELGELLFLRRTQPVEPS